MLFLFRPLPRCRALLPALLLFLSGPVWADAYLNGTVRVSVPGMEEGFGFIVGERGGDFYILTAEHVVRETAPGQTAPVQVYFYQDQARPVAAEVLLRETRPLDAALLRVPARVNWQPLPACAPPYTVPEPVWFIGRDRRWFRAQGIDQGQINETEPDHYGHLELSIGSVRPGTSGAPVFSARGLVGMMSEDAVNSARAVAIEPFLRRFVQQQNYPWQFTACGSVPPPVVTTPAPRPIPPPPAPSGPSHGDTWTEPSTGLEFVYLKGECFQMGSPEGEEGRQSDETRHEACVEDFWLAKTEVSNAQYRKFKRDHDSGSYNEHGLNADNQPAVNVSWLEAVAFTEWLNQQNNGRFKFRLPTEAEWEYAARAGTQTAYYWGNEIDVRYLNFSDKNDPSGPARKDLDDGHAVTAPVGNYLPNAFGLFDMLGNIWEWTCSEYANPYDGKESLCNNNAKDAGLRALRGGSWGDGPAGVRSAARLGGAPGSRLSGLGLRPARIE